MDGYTAELLPTAERYRQPKCPLTGEKINRICICIQLNYYLASKRNEILRRAVTWMNLENIVLSEIYQTQEIYHCMTPLL